MNLRNFGEEDDVDGGQRDPDAEEDDGDRDDLTSKTQARTTTGLRRLSGFHFGSFEGKFSWKLGRHTC